MGSSLCPFFCFPVRCGCRPSACITSWCDAARCMSILLPRIRNGTPCGREERESGRAVERAIQSLKVNAAQHNSYIDAL